MLPELDGFDHIHIYVADRYEAAQWYESVLGFKVSKTLEVWAENPQGPLTIEDPTGKIHLALFQSEKAEPSTAIAFKADGEAFLHWKTHLEKESILLRCTDHALAWSLYFNDCDGNMHEITTYEHDYVASRLPKPTTSSVQ